MELWHCAHKVAASPNLQRCPRLLLSQLRFQSNHIPVRALHQSLSPLRRAHPATLHHHKRCQSTVMSAAVLDGQRTAQVIDGKRIADTIRKEIAEEAAALKSKYDRSPGLAVVLVGARGDSATYVRMKRKACAETGIESFSADLPEDIDEEDLLKVVAGFNADKDVHGILVQLPLPKHINEQRILDAICLEKDVDGFHPANIGALAMRGRQPLFTSCTPKGCIELLKRSGIPISGKRAVVLGRSNIVGMPAALLLQGEDATVTVVHSRTPDAKSICKEADILIAAIGKPEMVKGDWIKSGATVIDVGTNPVEDSSKKSGYRLVGDVAFLEAKEHAGYITPVPGGVGPMTITMLLQNTVESAKREMASAQ